VSLDKNTRIALATGIFLLALLIRLLGIGWGLKNDLHNQSYHPDEPVIFAYSQAIEPTQLKFTPGFYNYGTLYLTMLRVATDMTTAYTGAPDLKNDDSFWQWVSRADLSGRVLSAIAGSLTAVFLFFLAYRFLGAVGGISAALVIVVAPGHVMHSRFQTVDVLAVMFLAASALCALKLLATPRSPDEPSDAAGPPSDATKWVIWAGILAGLSAGTKYTGILGVLTIVVAIYFATSDRKRALLLSAIGLLAAVGAFIVTTPGILLDSAAFFRDFKYEMTHTATGHGLLFADTSPGFIYHFANLFLGLGIFITIMGIGGLVWASVKKHPWAIALLVFWVAYYLLIGRAEVKFLRYTFPLYIGIAAGFGFLIAESQGTRWKQLGIGMAILALGGIDMGGLVGTSKVTTWMAGNDPRDQAAAWIKKQPDAATAGYSCDPWYWSVPLFPDATLPRMPMGPDYVSQVQQTGNPFLARMAIMGETEHPKLSFPYDPGPPVSYPNFNMKLLEQDKPEYIPMTSFEIGYTERLVGATDLEPGDRALVEEYDRFAKKLSEDYTLVARFGQPVPLIEDFHYVQPEVLVWKRKAQ
jgi:hypothetical protein